MKLCWYFLFAATLIVGLTSCYETTPPPPANTVTRLEISPNALLFTKLGEKQQLKARGFDANGQEVGANVTWNSSRPEQVSISETGELEARVALGASQIVAQVGNLKSAPMLVSVAQPAPGVQLISDAQIKSDPTVVDPNAEPSLDNPYEVVLTGIAPPAPGSLLLGRESKAIGGEVISSVIEGDGVRVRLKLVSIPTLMKTAQIKETIDFSKLEPSFPKELTDLYSVQVVGDEYNFTPKAKAASARALTPPSRPFEFDLGPFKCELIKSTSPLSLSQPAQFSLKFNPTLEIDFDSQTGLKKLIVRADVTAKVKASLVLSVSGLINVECQLQLYEKLLPLPGWAGLILAGSISAGIGFEMEGSIALPTIGLELSNETKANLEIGVDCSTDGCKPVRKMDVKNTPDLKFTTPNITNLRTEMFVFAYGFAKLKFGMTLLPEVRLSLLTVRAGVKLEGSFATRNAQLAPGLSPNDPDYRSSYKMSLLAELTAGPKNIGKTDLAIALQRLGIFKLNLLKFQLSSPLGTSPQGTVSQDKATFKAGDTVKFTVEIDPATTRLPILAAPLIYYNIGRILIVRKTGSDTSEQIAAVPASTDQTEFVVPWVADVDSDNALGKEFYAFVETALPMPFDLELGKAQPVDCQPNPNVRYCAFELRSPLGIGNSDEILFDSRVLSRNGINTIFTPPSNATLFRPRKINGLGQVAGFLSMKDGTTHGALFAGGVFTDFGSNKVANVGTIVDITGFNDQAQAVGLMETDLFSGCLTSFSFTPCTSYIFRSGTVKRFDGGGSGIQAIGIDNSGRVVVKNGVQGGKSYFWNGTTATPLDNEPCCTFFVANAVSPSGLVVGEKRVGNELVAFVYPSTALSTQQSTALAVNDAGAVVGSVKNTTATLWQGGNQIDLNAVTQLSGLNLRSAYAINSRGTILAGGTFDYILFPFESVQQKVADLELSMIAPAKALQESTLTYAVNLHNKNTTGAANNIRVEFYLPEGFVISDIQGWSGCTTIQTTVTCRLSSLAADERRAFLIDVKAPASGGVYLMGARVSANETDPNLTDNFAVGSTFVEEPTP